MKKGILLLFLAVLSIFGIALTIDRVQATASEGTVVFHYQKWDGNYASAGLYVWNTGDGGSSGALPATGTDAFGIYIEVTVGTDATEMGCIPISQDITTDARWGFKDSKDDADILIDVTAAAAGADMHVYFFSGSDQAFIADPANLNVFLVYFTATEVYEENLGIHAWGEWDQADPDMAAMGTWGTWGTPTLCFTGDFVTPQGKAGKIGMLKGNLDETPDLNLIVYAGTDATKKTADVKVTTTGLVAGDATAVYVSSSVYQGFDKATAYSDASFQFKFMGFTNVSGVLGGTYASKKNSILVEFSSEVPTAFYDDAQEPIITTYQKYEIVGYNYVPSPTPIVIDTTVYDPYVSAAIPETVAGRVVFHYQKWNSDYSDVGLWTWGTGTDGTQAPVIRSGVDDFGAVMVVNVDTDASDTIGLIPIGDQINTDDRWTYRETPDGQHINFDVTPIKNGTVDEIHVYYFQGGFQTYFVADPSKVNVIVLYMNTTGTYTATTGVHNWGWDTNAAGWGEPLPMTTCFKTPAGMAGIGVMVTADPAAAVNGGIIVHDGDTKYSGDANVAGIFGTTEAPLAAGTVEVVYAGIAGATAGSYNYTLVHDDFVDELMNWVKGDAIYDYVDYEKSEYPRVAIDIAPFFSLYKNDVLVADPFESLDFDLAKDSLTKLVIVLKADLDNTATYRLVFNNGETGIEEKVAEIEVAQDTEAPEIIFIGDDAVTIIAGEGWDTDLWPDVEATDDRDGTITDRIYVKSGEGTLDTNTPGVYPILMTAFDNWGNESQATFTITVEAPAEETGCAAASGSISLFGLLGITLFFVRRKETEL